MEEFDIAKLFKGLNPSIVVPVKARKELWIIGDEFLSKAEPYIHGIKQEADMARTPMFIFEAYDVKIASASAMEENPLKAITDTLIHLMHDNLTIPHTLVWVTGETLAEDLAIIQSGELVQYFFFIFKTLRRALFERRHQLPRKAVPQYKTRIMVTRMTPKSKPFSLENQFKTRRRGYNFALSSFCNRADVELINIQYLTSKLRKDFDNWGYPSAKGFEKFWHSFSDAIRTYDERQVAEKFGLGSNLNKPVAQIKPNSEKNLKTKSDVISDGEADDEDDDARWGSRRTRRPPTATQTQEQQELQLVNPDGSIVMVPVYHTMEARLQGQSRGRARDFTGVNPNLYRSDNQRRARGHHFYRGGYRGRGRYHRQGGSFFKGFKDFN